MKTKAKGKGGRGGRHETANTRGTNIQGFDSSNGLPKTTKRRSSGSTSKRSTGLLPKLQKKSVEKRAIEKSRKAITRKK